MSIKHLTSPRSYRKMKYNVFTIRGDVGKQNVCNKSPYKKYLRIARIQFINKYNVQITRHKQQR